jgi:outer membrane beta-barrel protein
MKLKTTFQVVIAVLLLAPIGAQAAGAKAKKKTGSSSSTTQSSLESDDSQVDPSAGSASPNSSAKAVPEKQSPSDKTKGGILKDFDTLGGNDVLLDKAKALNPETRVRVVQDRIVSRRNRIELAPEYSNVLGGDPYNKTQNVGLNVHYHINPQWSVGAKYAYSFNELRPEGNSLINDPNVTSQALIADIDYPKSQMMALVNWYPFYGKLNIFDMGVAHFDVYAIAGYGSMELKSGNHPTYTGGGGVGFWISQHLTARAEVRYQEFKAMHYNGEVEMNTTVLGLQVGYLL